MNFVAVRSPSSYNGIIGRPGVRKLHTVPSTVHRMLKFPVDGGEITLKSSRLVPLECAMVSGSERTLPASESTVEERIKINGKKAQQQLEDVCRLQRLKQSMPRRRLSAIENRLECRIPVWIPFLMLLGRIQRLPPNTNGKRR
ncbi:hypothetical protein Tco_1233995 [Tanacetum coccineum]